jgi:hypothetical protein
MGTTPVQRRQRVVQLVMGVLLGIAIAEGLSAVLGTSTATLGLIVFVAFVAATFAGEAFTKGGDAPRQSGSGVSDPRRHHPPPRDRCRPGCRRAGWRWGGGDLRAAGLSARSTRIPAAAGHCQ